MNREELSFDPIELCEARVFLEDYAVAVHMLRLCHEDERERRQIADDCRAEIGRDGGMGGDAAYWLARTREVRGFVDGLTHDRCKLLLFYHYIRGLTVEQTADELDISPRSAYRLKKEALALAAKELSKQRACS